VVPGAILLVGLALLYPDVRALINLKGLDLGNFGLFVLLAYAAGVLLQGVGNVLEKVWWWLWRGQPTDWIRTGKHHLLAKDQMAALDTQLPAKLTLAAAGNFRKMTAPEWYSITRQVYAAVAGQGKASRVDIFNGNYGLSRGIASALIVVIALTFIADPSHWQAHVGIAVTLAIACGFAIARMQRFGTHYARELFVQFLQIPSSPSSQQGP
jgi:hypothetical protein